MLVDAHCHPFDLINIFPDSEKERQTLGVLAAASACSADEAAYNEKLPNVLPCFGIHPQYISMRSVESGVRNEYMASCDDLLAVLHGYASAGRIKAIGECGFDLYSDEFKETQKEQERIFSQHLEISIKYDLPVVLHVRRAMHKIFLLVKTLAKCKAVIFHSWPGTFEEAKALLRHGVNVYFSFGNIIMLNHKKAVKSCALLPAERLLTETDAPYAPRHAVKFSSWKDLPLILETAAALRNTNVKDLENQIENNFRCAFAL